MKIKILKNKQIYGNIKLVKGQEYEVIEKLPANSYIGEGYKIVVPKKRKVNAGTSSYHVLITNDECKVIKESLLSKIKSRLGLIE